MKIFILEYVEQLTGNYHPEGGLVVIADNLERAKEICGEQDGCEPSEKEWDKAVVYDCTAIEEKIFVFPNTGCC